MPPIFSENNFQKETVKGKYNLAYSTINSDAGKPFPNILNAINSIAPRLYIALKALFVEAGEYQELPNPITLNTAYNSGAYPQITRVNPMPKFQGLSTPATTNPWGTTGTVLSDNDIAIITDLQIRVHALEQIIMGNLNSTEHKDLTGV